MSEDMLDDLYDCLLILSKIKMLDDLKSSNELEILDKAYSIVKHLYDKYTA